MEPPGFPCEGGAPVDSAFRQQAKPWLPLMWGPTKAPTAGISDGTKCPDPNSPKKDMAHRRPQTPGPCSAVQTQGPTDLTRPRSGDKGRPEKQRWQLQTRGFHCPPEALLDMDSWYTVAPPATSGPSLVLQVKLYWNTPKWEIWNGLARVHEHKAWDSERAIGWVPGKHRGQPEGD